MDCTISCKFKLHLSAEQKSVLLDTLKRYQSAMNFLLAENHQCKTTDRSRLHRDYYETIRRQFGLPSQHAINVYRETVSAYRTLWSNFHAECDPRRRQRIFDKPPVRRSLAARHTLNRNVSINAEAMTCRITTVGGRISDVRMTGWNEHVSKLREFGPCDPTVWYDRTKREFYLIVPITISRKEAKPTGALAIDVGERHLAAIATTAGRREVIDLPENVIREKRHIHETRRALARKGTRSATRRHQALGRREKRLTSDALHVISRKIVREHPNAVIGVEGLTGIRQRRNTHRGGTSVDDRRERRRVAEQWPFAEFRSKISYKSVLHDGIAVIELNPAFTSQTCPACGCVNVANRSGDDFSCVECGHRDHADLVAAVNLLNRLLGHL